MAPDSRALSLQKDGCSLWLDIVTKILLTPRQRCGIVKSQKQMNKCSYNQTYQPTKEIVTMKKTIKLIDLDCAHCAAKIENAAKKIDGVTDASVNFLSQKMVLEADDDRIDGVVDEVVKLVKKIEPDVTVKM